MDKLRHNGWWPGFTISNVLRWILELIEKPEEFGSHVFRPSLHTLYKKNRATYNKIAKEWTNKYALPPNDLPYTCINTRTPNYISS